MKTNNLIIFFFIFSLLVSPAMAQEKEVSNQTYFQNFLSTLDLGGYYRGFAISRDMEVPYGDVAQDKLFAINDPIYFDPMLFLYVGGSPTSNSSFGVELNMVNPLAGPSHINQNLFGMFQTIVLRGGMDLPFGKFNVTAGGIEWTRLSPFTFGNNIGYNRFSVFERRPWDPGGHVKGRYASYYYDGTIDQDIRFGSNAFKGFVINGYNMPGGLSMDFFYGKSAPNGGYDRIDQVMPKQDIAGKVTKELKGLGDVAINTYNSIQQTDSINAGRDTRAMYNMVTGTANINFKDIILFTEAGYGGYRSPNYPREFDPAFLVDVSVPAKYTLLPFIFRFYNIGPAFVNRNANFTNTTIPEVNHGFRGGQGAAVLLPAGGQMMSVGDLSNNRRGFNANTKFNLGRLKIQLANEFASDIVHKKDRDFLTYIHRVNGLAWSRFVQFPNPGPYFGPNNRVNSIYRTVYEVANLSDTNDLGEMRHKLHYNSIDVQAKFKYWLFGREIFFFNLNTFNSVQNKFSPIPIFDDQAYLRARYHEMEVYYHLFRDLMLNGYLGYERVKGNEYTDLSMDAEGNISPRNQFGRGIGVGFDFLLNNRTTFYVRHRWFQYEDRSLENEEFKGKETTIELKFFF